MNTAEAFNQNDLENFFKIRILRKFGYYVNTFKTLKTVLSKSKCSFIIKRKKNTDIPDEDEKKINIH